MDISIIVVNFNSGELLSHCIKSILQNIKGFSYEIIVVDNMSSDASFKQCRQLESPCLKLIQSGSNLGFSKANNLGAKYASGTILHFLNPDTTISESLNDDYCMILSNAAENLPCVYVNPLKDRDGKIYYSRNALPGTNNLLRYYLCRETTKWYYIGATLIISASNFNRIGKWNESFFMYGEDADIFCRINRNHFRIIEMPSVIFHYGGGSSENTFTNIQREILIQKSLRKYRKANQMSWFDFWIWQILVVLSFCRKPKRLWWQIKAIYLSFKVID